MNGSRRNSKQEDSKAQISKKESKVKLLDFCLVVLRTYRQYHATATFEDAIQVIKGLIKEI